MKTVKQDAAALIDALPDDVTMEDIQIACTSSTGSGPGLRISRQGASSPRGCSAAPRAMARRVAWSERALEDLEHVLEFIAKDSPIYASAVHDRFVARVALLPDQPGQGRRLPEHEDRDDLREVFVHRWRLIYRTTEDEVVIVAIVHGARQLKNVPPL